jgi:hypothetical protein
MRLRVTPASSLTCVARVFITDDQLQRCNRIQLTGQLTSRSELFPEEIRVTSRFSFFAICEVTIKIQLNKIQCLFTILKFFAAQNKMQSIWVVFVENSKLSQCSAAQRKTFELRDKSSDFVQPRSENVWNWEQKHCILFGSAGKDFGIYKQKQLKLTVFCSIGCCISSKNIKNNQEPLAQRCSVRSGRLCDDSASLTKASSTSDLFLESADLSLKNIFWGFRKKILFCVFRRFDGPDFARLKERFLKRFLRSS